MMILRLISKRRYTLIELMGLAIAYGAFVRDDVGVAGYFAIILGAGFASAAIYKFSKADNA